MKDRVYYGLKTHLEMLKDQSRCMAFQEAIEPLVKDKVVLDVGCGSGILSLFAARAGAKQVLAVDMDVPPGAEEVAKANGLEDQVQFFNGPIQEVQLPVDSNSVDVIVSEWMGGLLLMEDMLPAVIFARDKWLKPKGILLPDQAKLYLAPLKDVAGISSQQFPSLRENIASQLWVSAIDPSRFMSRPYCILDLNLNAVQEEDIKSYETFFHFILDKEGTLNGFGLWFDVMFNHTDSPVTLSTAPWLPPTHWAQGLWILPEDIEVKPNQEVLGNFNQTKISPSYASFNAQVQFKAGPGLYPIIQRIEANPSNMNNPGPIEEQIKAQLMTGDFQGYDVLWIGSSMSFNILSATSHGANSVSILNHSSWASRAMKQLAIQQGVPNIRFLSNIPSVDELKEKNILISGSFDSSWHSLISHIKVRRTLDKTDFLIQFSWEDSQWTEFYGFDFSAYAGHDLEMYMEEEPADEGVTLEDFTNSMNPSKEAKQTKQTAETIYYGKSGESDSSIQLKDGIYNRIRVSLDCGTVILPLKENLNINIESGRFLKEIELSISLIDSSLCQFSLILHKNTDETLGQIFQKPLDSMGHILSKP
jgi:SAM-dependent methyltransferase